MAGAQGHELVEIFDSPMGIEERLAELRRDLVSAAYLRGDFVLASGNRTQYFFDKYLFETKPSILRRIASCVATLLPEDVDRLAGSELGGVPLATAVSLETGLPFIVVRRPGDQGKARPIEGELYPGDKIVLVEDVVTTGSQAARVANLLSSIGANLVSVVAVIDREEGCADHLASLGYDFRALFRRRELELPE